MWCSKYRIILQEDGKNNNNNNLFQRAIFGAQGKYSRKLIRVMPSLYQCAWKLIFQCSASTFSNIDFALEKATFGNMKMLLWYLPFIVVILLTYCFKYLSSGLSCALTVLRMRGWLSVASVGSRVGMRYNVPLAACHDCRECNVAARAHLHKYGAGVNYGRLYARNGPPYADPWGWICTVKWSEEEV